MHNKREDVFKTVLQVFSILCLIGLLSMIFHKAWADVAVLWQQNAGGNFLAALARYLLRNLAG
jgi:hypothetical protein